MDFMFFLLSTNFCQSYECISKHHTSASLLFIPLESPHLVWWLQSKPFNSVQSQTVFFCMTKTVCIQMHVWKYYGAHIFLPYSLCFIFFFLIILYLLLFSHCEWGNCFLGRKWQIHTAISSVYVSYSAYLPAEQYLLLLFCQSLLQGLCHLDCLPGLCGNWISYLICTIWWNDRVNRLALNFHLLLISNDFCPRQNKVIHCIPWTLVSLLC